MEMENLSLTAIAKASDNDQTLTNVVTAGQLNDDIEETCHKCNECLLSSDNPATAPLQPWLVPKQP